jgi:hypothetical protein
MSLDEEERAREREQREAAVEERRQAKRARPEPPVATAIPQTLMAAYSADEAKRATLPKVCSYYHCFFPGLMTTITELVLLHTRILSKYRRERPKVTPNTGSIYVFRVDGR